MSFVNHHIEAVVVSYSYQQLTLLLTLEDGTKVLSNVVCAKCSDTERLSQWDVLYSLSLNFSILCMVGGDLNVILSGEEKIQG